MTAARQLTQSATGMAADQVGQSRTAVASDRGDGFRMGR